VDVLITDVDCPDSVDTRRFFASAPYVDRVRITPAVCPRFPHSTTGCWQNPIRQQSIHRVIQSSVSGIIRAQPVAASALHGS